ncbi:MAG: DUF58 domain-containing protein [Gammaproteobacteria bacterium]|nr:DUF58 domain-containing protein [Gammaproteobacteria bacterium]
MSSPTAPEKADPRVYTTLDHLRSLEGKARGLRFNPNQPSNSLLNGRHASRLRGRGLNFEEMRHYLPGDDIRSIDWKATARTGKAHVRVFTEERDRPVLLIVDQRMSMYFGSSLNLKSVTAAEGAALTAFAVLAGKDRVGGIVFGDDDMVELKPKRSRRALNLFLSHLADRNLALHADRAVTSTMPINKVLRAVGRMAIHDHLIVVFSDFDGIDDATHEHLTRITAHNDLILTLVHDPMAEAMPKGGSLIASDGDLQIDVDLGSTSTHEALLAFASGRLQRIRNWQQDLGIAVLPLTTDEDTAGQIRRLLGHRQSARRSA